MEMSSEIVGRKASTKCTPAEDSEHNSLTYRRGEHFVVVPLSDKDGDVFDLQFLEPPTYYARPGVVRLDANAAPARGVPAVHLPGAVRFEALLSRAECAQLIALSEAMGWFETRCLGDATKSGKRPPAKLAWALDVADVDTLFARCRHLFQERIVDDDGVEYELAGINPRMRLFRYFSDDALGIHKDRDMYPGSAVDVDEQLRYDHYPQPGCTSLMSLLVFLNDDFDGGCTSFYVPSDGNSTPHTPKTAHTLEHSRVTPQAGAGVAFIHGARRKLSLLHAGDLVTRGVKYITRTDVLYRRLTPVGEPSDETSGDATPSSESLGESDY